jgi:zinc/manganese transport system substrate-binding protein
MKKIIFIMSLLSSILFANINVDTSYSTLGAIIKEIGKDNVKVTVLGSSKYDPHFIVPKPSLLSKLRRADLLIINGGGLELGWLPPLIRNANNAKIQNGAKGFLDISHFIPMIDVPTSVSRAFGDVHSQGNPHYSTDPHLVLTIAKAIKYKLMEIDANNSDIYEKNYKEFSDKWQTYLDKLDAKMQSCKTKKVVQYHEIFNYFLDRYEIKNYGNIEPLPGIAPSSKHTIQLIRMIKENDIKVILQDVYHERKTSEFIADKTGVKVRIIPHDLGADGSKTLEEFYNNIADNICK